MPSGIRAVRRLIPTETVSVVFTHEEASKAYGILSNISEHGACLITNVLLDRDAKVRVKLGARRLGELIETDARVVWCAEGVDQVKAIVGVLVGIAFLNVGEELRSRIDELLDSDLFQEVVPAEDSDPTLRGGPPQGEGSSPLA